MREASRDAQMGRDYDFFLVMNACMVLFMQSGFALLEAGSVRAKNVTNILIKNLLDVVVGAIVYWACGFAFAYGKVKRSEHDYFASNSFIGFNHFFLYKPEFELIENKEFPVRIIHGGSFYGEFFFNFVFAATATTIISGAVAERVEFLSYLVYGVVATGFIQPVAVHWGWSNGWLLYPPDVIRLPPAVWYRDYAGGGNVHAVGGIAALVGCVFMGPREGRFEDGRKYHIPGHSTPLTCMGAFILIIGFLAMVLGHGDNVALGVTNLTIGGSMSGITCMCIVFIAPKLEYLWKYKIKKIPRSRKIKPKQYWSFLVLVDATLAGMVAMCAGCNVLEPFGAAIIGIVAGFGFAVTEHWLHIRQIDDPVGSIPVHLTGGVIGVLMAPLFANKEEEYSFIHWKGCNFDCVGEVNSTCVYNLGFQGNVSTGRRPLHHGYKLGDCLYTPMNQLLWQMIGIVAILMWTLVLSSFIFWICWYCDILRVDMDTEVRGIDIAKHGEPAYPNAAYGHGWDTEGQFDVDWLRQTGIDTIGKRSTKALLNPNKQENWDTVNEQTHLRMLARSFRKKFYRGGPCLRKSCEFCLEKFRPHNILQYEMESTAL